MTIASAVVDLHRGFVKHEKVMGLRYDESDFPIVFVTLEGNITDEEWALFIRGLDGTTARSFRENQRVAFVIDTLKGKAVSAAQRRQLADWMNANDASSRATTAAFAFVIGNPIVRGALTAVLWLARMPAPYRVVANVGEGAAFAREQLGDAAPVGMRVATG